ncbi:MAG: hypothetical protein QMD85_04365, partial [Candidatus Aenigmarchaeota archaeon]|nr:hypothetical protein [Candidatus Aenigmarchaeota archaeon]MDI6722806.1 hypothetical protein [Candidatus Aenigmarchaeota archaeon]
YYNEKVKTFSSEINPFRQLLPENCESVSDDNILLTLIKNRPNPIYDIFEYCHPDASFIEWEDKRLLDEIGKIIENQSRTKEDVDRFEAILKERSHICVKNSLSLADSLYRIGDANSIDTAAIIGYSHKDDIESMFKIKEMKKQYGLDNVQLRVYTPKRLLEVVNLIRQYTGE